MIFLCKCLEHTCNAVCSPFGSKTKYGIIATSILFKISICNNRVYRPFYPNIQVKQVKTDVVIVLEIKLCTILIFHNYNSAKVCSTMSKNYVGCANI